MADSTQLPHLLRLLDDDAREVRRAILAELGRFGPGLKDEIDRLPASEAAGGWQRVCSLLAEHRRAALKDGWRACFEKEGDNERLEAAAALLSRFLSGDAPGPALSALLDSLAREFLDLGGRRDVYSLADFLFHEKALRGAPSAEYYDPRNSDLVHVIERKRGLPISLTCVYMLVGHRVGFEIEGCNFPGHFLARLQSGGRTLLVDCFHGGRFFEEADLLRSHSGPTAALRKIIYEKTGAELIVARILRNLIGAYERVEESENRRLMSEILALLPRS